MAETSSPYRKYHNPPIQEAVCEVNLIHQKPLTLDEFGRMGRVWKREYPNQQTVEEKALQFEISLGKSSISEKVLGHKLLARSEDGKDIVQLGPLLLAVNRLPPYPGWDESFRDTILRRANDVRETLGLGLVSRIGLRYINRIQLPEGPVTWRNWFNATPSIPASLSGEPLFFQSHTELPLEAGLQANINFGSLPGKVTHVVMLDIDVFWQGNVPIGELSSMLDKVHNPHRLIFESYLTDSLRTFFNPF